jgi:hypothetical protein
MAPSFRGGMAAAPSFRGNETTGAAPNVRANTFTGGNRFSGQAYRGNAYRGYAANGAAHNWAWRGGHRHVRGGFFNWGYPYDDYDYSYNCYYGGNYWSSGGYCGPYANGYDDGDYYGSW